MRKLKLSIAFVLVSAMVLFSACVVEKETEIDNTSSQQENSSDVQSSTNNIKGTIVASTQIENSEGGYYIPIPESWFNKVSYETNGTHTYIYHITKYKDELETNPVLLHIDVSDNLQDTTGKNVFLNIGEKAYYEVIRFDAPYNQGSKDDIEYSALIEDIPQILQSVSVTDTLNTNEQINTQSIIGQIITSNEIENQEGGYYVPIPDSWFNRVSYVIDGTATYFYHITMDQNELELNPILLHIDVSDNLQDEMGKNIFLEIGQKSYYEVIRFDFPYSSEQSDDGQEFSSFTADIPMMLQSTWLIDDTELQNQIQDMLTSPFNQYDACINSLCINMASKDQFMSMFTDEPINYESVTYEATGDTIEKYDYTFGSVCFSYDTLIFAHIIDPSISGPRNIYIGDHIDDVTIKFSLDAELSADDFDILYRANSGSESEVCVPPCGRIIKYDDGTRGLYYACFDEYEDLSDVTMDELEYDYVFIPQYDVLFEFDEKGYLYSFYIEYGTHAE